MRLVRKLLLVLVTLMVAVLILDAWVGIRRETRLLETDMNADERDTGQALAAAIGALWRTDGRERALQLVGEAQTQPVRVAVRWVDPHAGAERPDAPSVAAVRDRVARGEVFSVIPNPEGEVRRRIYTYVPVMVEGVQQGALELSESLSEEQAHLRHLVLQRAVTAGGLAVLFTAAAWILGAWFVGRPMHALVDKARRVGAGDLGGPLVLNQQDEIGDLAAEINAMCEQLDAARKQLASETQARIHALEQLRHADRLATVGQLAAGVAHELGTPLNVVTQRAKMIATGEVQGAEAADGARIVFEQSQRITGVIRQLLDFARRRSPTKAPQDVRSIAEQTTAFLAPLARKSSVEVQMKLPEAPVVCDVDSGQIQQVLLNLMMNGIHAMKRGGTLHVEVDTARVVPPADVGGIANDYIRVRVRDTGAGIAPENQARIFEPFFTTKDVGEGTGLGLAVSWGIVREHEGWLEVESQVGQGSTFAVFLPAQARATEVAV